MSTDLESPNAVTEAQEVYEDMIANAPKYSLKLIDWSRGIDTYWTLVNYLSERVLAVLVLVGCWAGQVPSLTDKQLWLSGIPVLRHWVAASNVFSCLGLTSGDIIIVMQMLIYKLLNIYYKKKKKKKKETYSDKKKQ